MNIVANIMLVFALGLAWLLIVLFILPCKWYNYRIVKECGKFYCEKRLKMIGIFWHRMWVDEYLSDEFDTYDKAKHQLDVYLTPATTQVYSYTYTSPKEKAN